ncbi:MAG: DUF177 domain-containing protein [Oscillatoriales cyanobacterium RM1_1_9]|nr:DUF177 domain-containing protein [Oscillatoriales cyanobacterium RM2_1_1]NJO71941.1 DUF177 domain-containing protein [Oscillatoriales cyanobacterium RM1_1_9]
MDAIYIPHLLKSQNRSIKFQFSEMLSGLETLTPVRGEMAVIHQNTYLEVVARAEAIVTLVCHRCLNQYNHRLVIDTSEIIWLANSTGSETEIEVETPLEELVEILSPEGYFEPGDWVYQNLCLIMPLQQLCDGPCEIPNQNPGTEGREKGIDSRWAALADLKQQLQ